MIPFDAIGDPAVRDNILAQQHSQDQFAGFLEFFTDAQDGAVVHRLDFFNPFARQKFLNWL